MKNLKKIGLSLSLLFILLGIFIAIPQHSLAYVATSQDQITNATFKYVNALTITANIGGQDVNFVADPNPIYISQIIYKAQNYDCYGQIAMPADVSKGFSLADVKLNPSLIGSSTQANIDIDYNPSQTKCRSFPNFTKAIDNPELGSTFFTQTDANTIKSDYNKDSYTLNSDGYFYKTSESQCVDRLAVVDSGAIFYELDANKGKSIPGSDIGLGDISSCKVVGINFQEPSNTSDAQQLVTQTVSVANLIPNSGGTGCSSIACRNTSGAGSTGSTTSSGDNSGGNTCSLNSSGASIAWLLCPALEAADALASQLMNLFESQLPFCIVQPGANCSAKTGAAQNLGSGQDQVKQAWTIIKNIASAVLVIVMLIIIISQALGEGIVQSYTAKKILPRLVAAAILMQFSWVFFAYIIDVVNDIGIGLGALMYAPFGGASSLSFGALLDHAGIGTGQGIFIGWLGGFLGLAIGLAYLPTLLVGAFAAVLTLIVGLGVLVFRKVLIILLLIFSPLALVVWILPNQGTQRLWKLWQENFTKVLMMFPLIVALIAAGRIFAYIVGATKNGTFLNFWFVVIGYFVPLFILPKAYKWGGSLMTSAGNAIGDIQRNVQRSASPGIKQWGQDTFQGKWADRYKPSDGTFKRGLRRVQSGHYLPTKRSRNLTLATGKKWAGERNEEADAYQDKWVRTFQEQGITQKQADKWNKMMRDKGYKGPNTFKAMKAGVGAGKQSARGLALEAFDKGDDRLEKAVFRYLPRTASTLEFGDPDYLFAQEGAKKGEVEWVPGWGHKKMIDQEFKDPETYRAMGALRQDWPAHNTPYGGASYRKYYQKALPFMLDDEDPTRYKRDAASGQLIRNKDYYDKKGDPTEEAKRYGKELFELDPTDRVVEQTVGVDEQGRAIIKPVRHERKWLAHYLQAIDEDTLNNVGAGGNAMLTFFREATGWANKTEIDPVTQKPVKVGLYGDGASQLPAQEVTKQVVEMSHTAAGRSKIQNLKASPAHVEAVEDAFKAAGYTHFKDSLGQVHELSVENLFTYNEMADRQQQSGAVQVTAPPSKDDSVLTLTPQQAAAQTGPARQQQGPAQAQPQAAPAAAPQQGPAQAQPQAAPAAAPAGTATPGAATIMPASGAPLTPGGPPVVFQLDHEALGQTLTSSFTEALRRSNIDGTPLGSREPPQQTIVIPRVSTDQSVEPGERSVSPPEEGPRIVRPGDPGFGRPNPSDLPR